MSHQFSLVSLGCARTLVDSEKMIDQLRRGGFAITPEGSGEQITILNTCSFIQSAIDETEANIEALIAKKEAGDLKYVVVSGCYPSRFKKEELTAKYPLVDLWLTTHEEGTIQEKLAAMVFKRRFTPVVPKQYLKLTPSHFAYIKISEGCDNWCSFCTIPKIRGKHTSKPLEEVITEAKLQVSFGAKELILIAEDTTCWGEDLYGKPSLPILLEALAKVEGVEWIRAMYIFPPRVDEALVKVIKDNPTICRYLDMPIQHVNSELLKAMGRGSTQDDLRRIYTLFKQEIPELVFRTTLIIGFPGETEAHVDELIAFIEQYPFTQLGAFLYSEERETRSARLGDKVPREIAQKRLNRVMSAQKKSVQAQLASRKNETIQVLYEGDGIARSFREAPDVDGVVLIANPESLKPGQFYTATITGSKGYDTEARVLTR
ncbi:MAG: 30S ribosomal protein S12 methylthiotransferase RimO [Candidatus Margulisiibacteriota bacterium]